MRVFWKRHKTIYCWFIFGCIFCNSCQFRGSHHHHHHHMVVISSGGTRVTQSQVLRAVSSTSCTNTSPALIYIILGRQQCTALWEFTRTFIVHVATTTTTCSVTVMMFGTTVHCGSLSSNFACGHNNNNRLRTWAWWPVTASRRRTISCNQLLAPTWKWFTQRPGSSSLQPTGPLNGPATWF